MKEFLNLEWSKWVVDIIPFRILDIRAAYFVFIMVDRREDEWDGKKEMIVYWH